LVVDDMTIIREPVAASLRAAGYQTICAASGEEALLRIRAQRPQLVLLDLSMPGMSGLATLKVIRSEPALAGLQVILLTASSDKSQIIQAARLGVRDYLLKSNFSTEDLLARVTKYMPLKASAGEESTTPSSNSPCDPVAKDALGQTDQNEQKVKQVSRTEAMRRIARAEIKAMPSAVADLIAMAGSPRASITEAAEILKQDPMLSARVLRLANSAAFSSQRVRISTIDEAAKNVGLAALRNLAASAGIFDMAGGASDERFLRILQNCLAVSTLMDQLAPQNDESAHGLAYVIGLCQSLPDMMLRQYFRSEYEQAILQAQRTGASWRQVVGEVFDIPYANLMWELLNRLGLPAPVTTSIREFFDHDPNESRIRMRSPLARLLVIANYCAAGLMLNPRLDEPLRPILEAEMREAIGAPPPNIDMTALRSNAVMTAALLAGVSQSQMEKVAEPPIKRMRLKLVYVRGEGFASLDPLHELLKLLAGELQIRTEGEPWTKNLDQSDAVVLATQNALSQVELAELVSKMQLSNGGRSIPMLCLASRTEDRVDAGYVWTEKSPTTVEAIAKFVKSADQQILKHAA
jgi:CheY-like chemotaxis protein/HD-like signal output (HDOD) protein